MGCVCTCIIYKTAGNAEKLPLFWRTIPILQRVIEHNVIVCLNSGRPLVLRVRTHLHLHGEAFYIHAIVRNSQGWRVTTF